MRVVALISGGKDSCYNMMKCVSAGHEIVALANLQPAARGELDSYMFQTVGHEGIHLYAEAMGLPLYQATTNGVSVTKEMTYHPCAGDEVEDLYQLLLRVKQEVKGGVEGVATGAILSDYQRLRVESICVRLGLVSLAYLWRRDQEELLLEMVEAGVHAILIKVAAMGLQPDKHLGKTIKEMHSELCSLNQRYGINVCGEGGEYETFTLDCPLFKKRIVIEDWETVVHSDDAFAPVAYLRLSSLRLQDKDIQLRTPDQHSRLPSIHPGNGTPDNQQEILAAPSTNFPKNSISWIRWNGDPLKVSIQDQTRDLFARFGSRLCAAGCSWSDVVFVYLLLADMACYKMVNDIYLTFFPSNPPGRVCVGMALPDGVHLCLDAVVAPLDGRDTPEEGEMAVIDRRSMHVQSISEWAPANIGPYSQAYAVGDVVFLAGQIGLDPASMRLVSGSHAQASLSLSHVRSVLQANKSSLSAALCGTCYYTTDDCGWSARQAMSQSDDLPDDYRACPVMFLHVSSLPRSADVEWHFVSLRQPHSPAYWSSTEYVDSAGLLSVQEAWCDHLHMGAWLVETCLPYFHYGSSHLKIRTQVQVCLEHLQQVLHRHCVTLDDVTCINFYLPKQGAEHPLTLPDLQKILKEKFRVSAATVSITATSEHWAITRRMTVHALKLSLLS